MVLRHCDYNDCQQPAERLAGNCMICGQHLCLIHTSPAFHPCPREVLRNRRTLTWLTKTQQDDADKYFEAYDAAKISHQEKLIAKINFKALQEIASSLRDGAECILPVLKDGNLNVEMLTSQMGGQNLHVDIIFEDGCTWIARIRLDDPMLAPALTRDLIVESEVATLKFLSKTKVPSSKVYHYTLSSNIDAVGAPYMLMDKLKGQALDWQSLEADKKSKVLAQLADIFIELSRYPFDKTGSLSLDDARKPVVGGFAQAQLFKEPYSRLGPFPSTKTAAENILNFYLDMYTSGELADFSLDNYLAFTYRKTLIGKAYSPQQRRPSFYLKHFDDKGDHILIDEEANITGIIDWEFASAECEELAFSTPCMLWPVAEYYDGKNELAAEEQEFCSLLRQKGHQRLADKVLRGRFHQRFWFFLGGGAPYDRAEFTSLFDGLRKAYADQFENGASIKPYDEWCEDTLASLTASDPRLQLLLRRERALERRDT